MPRRIFTATGSVLGKNRNTSKKTNHQLGSDSNIKKRMTAKELEKHEREIRTALRSMRGRRNLSEAELD